MAQRLALVIHALSHGGAERVLAELAAYWANQGREVTLITLARVETDTYPLPASVRRIGLDLQRESRTWWQRLTNHRRRVRRSERHCSRCIPTLSSVSRRRATS
ncbi:MAG: hypothetical protein U0903_08945 [Planctomycetales bacterium]